VILVEEASRRILEISKSFVVCPAARQILRHIVCSRPTRAAKNQDNTKGKETITPSFLFIFPIELLLPPDRFPPLNIFGHE
jgi:hypothetical protein